MGIKGKTSDETDIFWRALPDKGFGERKACKLWIICTSGMKEKPIAIAKSENPRCLKGFDKSLLPVTYFSQKKAWMTGEILRPFLLNSFHQNRSFLLLLDNAGCHFEHLTTKVIAA